MRAVRVGITSLVLGAVIFACGTEDTTGNACTARDMRSCECDSGDSGTQVCLQDETGFTPCACPAAPAPTDSGADAAGGGSSGAGGGAGSGGGGAGSGGTSGAGGTPPADGAIPDAGPVGDVALIDGAAPEASVTQDAPIDVATGDGSLCSGVGTADPCRLCMAQNCCTELLACAAPDPCEANNETDCMLQCLGGIAADGGVVTQPALNNCSQTCGAGATNVSQATRDLFVCVFGNAACRTGCGF